MTVKQAVEQFLHAFVAAHRDRLSLDLVSTWDISVEQFCDDVTIMIKVGGLRIKDANRDRRSVRS